MLSKDKKVWVSEEYEANLRHAAKTMTDDEFHAFKNRLLRVCTALSAIEDGDEELLFRWLRGENTAPIDADDIWIQAEGTDLYYAKRYFNLFCNHGIPGLEGSEYVDLYRIRWVCTNGNFEGKKDPCPTAVNFFEAFINKLYPIKLPYLPSEETLSVYFSQFSYHGDYRDTVAIQAVRNNDGKLKEVFRFFKILGPLEDETIPDISRVEEIDKNEYVRRWASKQEE